MEDLCLAFVENSVVNMHCDSRTQRVLRKPHISLINYMIAVETVAHLFEGQ